MDAALRRIRDMLPQVETHKAAILAALAITDELFQARRGDREHAARLNAMADDLARLLPPPNAAAGPPVRRAFRGSVGAELRLSPRIARTGQARSLGSVAGLGE